MHPVAALLADAFRMNTRLYRNCLDGVDDEAARRRPSVGTNSLAFVALHLVDSRHFVAGMIGAPAPHPFAALLQDARGIDNLLSIPRLTDIRDAWDAVSPVVEARLAALDDQELAAPSPQRFPLDDATVAGALTFLAHHDSYHVGQMALLRKYLGFEPMRYT